jgi:hypothetical protein
MTKRGGVGRSWVVRILAYTAVISGLGAAVRGAEDSRAITATIDRLIGAQWQENRAVPAARADDGEFLRRVSLDLTGKIPTASEARVFLDDARADKRERLVDRLLDSPGYVSHFTAVEMRLLIPEVDSNPQVQALAPSFEAWLREQVAANAGSDRIVRAVLTATVTAQRDGGPGRMEGTPSLRPSPLPFYVAKDVKSENLAASTARLFLGLRLECAQCHNHPFAPWTREQFWGYAAFFASLERRDSDDLSLAAIGEQVECREVVIPGMEKRVRAAFLDGTTPPARPKVPARVALADWMTSPGNPYFARAAVNRIWAQLFGVGLVDPVDDMGADNPPSHPELLDALARAFAEHGFDRKLLLRAIVLSRPYQLTTQASAPSTGASTDAPRLFARMNERGLTAEQLYDSLAQAIGLAPDELGPERFAGARGLPRGEFLEAFSGNDEKPTEAQMSILQALVLMNGRLVAGATHLETGRMLTAVAEAPFLDRAGRIETLFLATLSRRPRPEEAACTMAHLNREAGGDPRKALSDIFWALLNSPEFLLNH